MSAWGQTCFKRAFWLRQATADVLAVCSEDVAKAAPRFSRAFRRSPGCVQGFCSRNPRAFRAVRRFPECVQGVAIARAGCPG
eukprot:11180384-Lingulodinium_polyedra.AAC.1